MSRTAAVANLGVKKKGRVYCTGSQERGLVALKRIDFPPGGCLGFVPTSYFAESKIRTPHECAITPFQSHATYTITTHYYYYYYHCLYYYNITKTNIGIINSIVSIKTYLFAFPIIKDTRPGRPGGGANILNQ